MEEEEEVDDRNGKSGRCGGEEKAMVDEEQTGGRWKWRKRNIGQLSGGKTVDDRSGRKRWKMWRSEEWTRGGKSGS